MWAATPILTALVGSVRGPLVDLRQLGLEQRLPALSAIVSIVAFVKLSLLELPMAAYSIISVGNMSQATSTAGGLL